MSQTSLAQHGCPPPKYVLADHGVEVLPHCGKPECLAAAEAAIKALARPQKPSAAVEPAHSAPTGRRQREALWRYRPLAAFLLANKGTGLTHQEWVEGFTGESITKASTPVEYKVALATLYNRTDDVMKHIAATTPYVVVVERESFEFSATDSAHRIRFTIQQKPGVNA